MLEFRRKLRDPILFARQFNSVQEVNARNGVTDDRYGVLQIQQAGNVTARTTAEVIVDSPTRVDADRLRF
ncbi:hypothetical protein D3C86_1386980 [compost metagenome]